MSESEDLPHKSGITTRGQHPQILTSASEDLPHKSGITTRTCTTCVPVDVGRLAPQIGDYDWADER